MPFIIQFFLFSVIFIDVIDVIHFIPLKPSVESIWSMSSSGFLALTCSFTHSFIICFLHVTCWRFIFHVCISCICAHALNQSIIQSSPHSLTHSSLVSFFPSFTHSFSSCHAFKSHHLMNLHHLDNSFNSFISAIWWPLVSPVYSFVTFYFISFHIIYSFSIHFTSCHFTSFNVISAGFS